MGLFQNTYTLADGDIKDINVHGVVFYMRQASTNALRVSFDDETFATFKPGILITADKPFQKVRIQNATGTSQTCEVYVSNSKLVDMALVVDTVIAVNKAVDTLTTKADVTVATSKTALCSANANRRELLIQNTGAYDIRVGDTNVSLTRGIKLEPGQSTTLETTAAVDSIADTTASTASVTELEAS